MKILICGAGGFIGSHLVRKLRNNGNWIRGVDLKYPDFSDTTANDFVIGDLRDSYICKQVVDMKFDEVYQLAADMGGAGFVFTGDNDADIMHNSATINLNILEACYRRNCRRIFYSSSACIYPEYNQQDPNNPKCSEDSAYPAMPDSEYGWEKLFSERLYLSFQRNYGMETRIARLHNIYGHEGTWKGGREKAPAALCRKIIQAESDGGIVNIWGDGEQTRSFLFIEDCLEGIIKLIRSEYTEPVNIGSEEMVTIKRLADIIVDISGKYIHYNFIPGPQGVRGRNSDNKIVKKVLDWKPKYSLKEGLEITYDWIEKQISLSNRIR